MVYGWVKTSLVDYPDRVATVLFTAGCNMDCEFCSNHTLIPKGDNARILDNTVIKYLTINRSRYDGVVISGGEPTLYHGLIPLIKQLKSLGLAVKLDTNGTDYLTVLYLIENDLIDYIAMDIKGGDVPVTEDQHLLTDLLKCDIIDYELRSTVYPPYFAAEYLPAIAARVSGAKRYVLQQYVPVIGKCEVDPLGDAQVWALRNYFAPSVTSISIRGLK